MRATRPRGTEVCLRIPLEVHAWRRSRPGLLLADDHGDRPRRPAADPRRRTRPRGRRRSRRRRRGGRAGLRTEIDLAILDVSMPQAHRPAGRARDRPPTTGDPPADALDARQRGVPVRGALGRCFRLRAQVRADPTSSARAARPCAESRSCTPAAVTTLIRSHLERRRDDPDHDPLSPREQEVVKLIAQGISGREIAETLTISPGPSSATARTSSRSSACRTASTHPLRHPTRTHRALRRWGRSPMAPAASAPDAVRDDPHRRRR